MNNRHIMAERITPREIEIIRLVAQGLTNQEIGERLSISRWTARTHVSTVLGKTGARNRVELTLWALSNGIAQAPRPTWQTCRWVVVSLRRLADEYERALETEAG